MHLMACKKAVECIEFNVPYGCFGLTVVYFTRLLALNNANDIQL